MSPESDKESLFFVPSFSCLSKISDDELHSELETLYSILNCRLSIKSILSEMIFTDEEFKSLNKSISQGKYLFSTLKEPSRTLNFYSMLNHTTPAYNILRLACAL